MKKNGYLSRRLALLPTSWRLMHPRPPMTVERANRLTHRLHNLQPKAAKLVHEPYSTGFPYLGFDAVLGLQLLQKLSWFQVRVQNGVLPFNR